MLPSFMKHYQMDFSNVFVPTPAFTESEDMLHEHHVLMITGPPGSGKTMIAQQLMLKLWNVNFCHPFRVTKPSEYIKNCNPNIPQIFHIDDAFGCSTFVKGKYDAWVPLFGIIRDDLRSGNTYIIFTSRDNILNAVLADLTMYELFSHVINLSDNKFKLTEEIKSDIFQSHAKVNNIDIEYSDTVEFNQTAGEPMGYPQRVRLLCVMKDVPNEARLRYFNHPMEYLSAIIGSYRENDHLSYCIIILLLMHDGKLPVSSLHEANKASNLVQTCLGICDLPSFTTIGSLLSTAQNLCGSFLDLIDDVFVYQHESIMEAATLDFGRYFPFDILNRCSLQFLLERVFTQNSAPPDNHYVVILQANMFSQLCKRVVKEIQGCLYFDSESLSRDGEASSDQSDPGCLRSLSAYRVFKDPKFLNSFLKHLQNTTSLNVLLTSSSPRSPHPTFLFLAATSGQDALVQEFLSSFLHALQQLPGLRDHLDRVLYAACYSGAANAVNALLLSETRADFRTAHDPVQVMNGWWWEENPSCTTLMHAAWSGNVDVLSLVHERLQQQSVDVTDHIGLRAGQGKTALLWCAKGGRGAAASQFLLDAGADVNAADDQGCIALHWSAWCGDEGTIRVLLNAGANINATEKRGQTSLHWAAEHGHSATVSQLLAAGANIDLVNIMGETSLHRAAEHGQVAIARLLVKAGADIHDITASLSPLEVAIHRGHTALADVLLSLSTADVLLVRCSVQFLLQYVVTKCLPPHDKEYVIVLPPKMLPPLCLRLVKEIQRCVEQAVTYGKDDSRSLSYLANYRVFRDVDFLHVFLCHLQQTDSFHILIESSSPDSEHLTFLFFAAASGQDDHIRVLLSSHLHDLRHLSGFRDHLDRILYAACNSGCLVTVRELLAAGAWANYKTAYNPHQVRRSCCSGPPTCTGLMHAAYSGNVDVLRLVLDHLQKQRVDVVECVSIGDGENNTALHWGAQGRRGDAVLQILLDAGAEVDARNEGGRTALHWSAQGGDEAAVCALLKARSDVNVVNKAGDTPLHFAADHDRAETARLLIKAQADVNIANGAGDTPLHRAAEHDSVSTVNLLLMAGADIKLMNIMGDTALHRAAEHGHVATVRLLVEANADIDTMNRAGETPLYRAAEHGQAATAHLLLVMAGADIHIRASSSSPLEVAIHRGHTALADIFLKLTTIDVFIDRCSVQFLLRHVLTKDSGSPNNEYLVVLHPNNFQQMCARLVKEIQTCVSVEGESSSTSGDVSCHEGDLRALAACRMFKDPAFRRIFLSGLHNTESFHVLLESPSRRSQHPTFLFLAAALGQDALVKDIFSSYLFAVRGLSGFRDHVNRILYASCYGGSLTAVDALLAVGARADYMTAHRPDDVMEGWWANTPTCTTLMHAAYSGSAEVLGLILDHLQQQRVNVAKHIMVTDGRGRTALQWGEQGGRGSVALPILLDAGGRRSCEVHGWLNRAILERPVLS